MKVTNILIDSEYPDRALFIYEDDTREIKQYPPFDEIDKKAVEELGGHEKISLTTYRYNAEIQKFDAKFEAFNERVKLQSNNFVIDAIMEQELANEELMKLKLSIFEHEFVKNSKNKKVLTGLRVSKDPIELIMYFGMLRKEANDKLS